MPRRASASLRRRAPTKPGPCPEHSVEGDAFLKLYSCNQALPEGQQPPHVENADD